MTDPTQTTFTIERIYPNCRAQVWSAWAVREKKAVWLGARDNVKRRLADTFDQKAFHAHSLGLGPLGLDQLATELSAFAEQADG